ncbi:MAG: hypothetical protein LUM44_09025 [Pyrinomonadaceae bacterium]|nr:hypothetical protein [Pyrinomonadaceae bacterium]
MKNTIKFFLVIVLFCSTVFADGSMGNGGFADEGNMGNGFTDGSMGNGKTCAPNTTCLSNSSTPTDSVIKFIQDYLISIFG